MFLRPKKESPKQSDPLHSPIQITGEVSSAKYSIFQKKKLESQKKVTLRARTIIKEKEGEKMATQAQDRNK